MGLSWGGERLGQSGDQNVRDWIQQEEGTAGGLPGGRGGDAVAATLALLDVFLLPLPAPLHLGRPDPPLGCRPPPGSVRQDVQGPAARRADPGED